MLKGQKKETTDEIIENDGFFPDLSLLEFCDVRCLPINTNKELLKMALVMSLSSINRQLTTFKSAQNAKAIYKLSDVHSIIPNEYETVYKIAVFARAKADLVGEWVTTANQKEKIDDNQTSARNELLAESARAVRHLAGLTRIGVALI